VYYLDIEPLRFQVFADKTAKLNIVVNNQYSIHRRQNGILQANCLLVPTVNARIPACTDSVSTPTASLKALYKTLGKPFEMKNLEDIPCHRAATLFTPN
jgi:hypothetical protein